MTAKQKAKLLTNKYFADYGERNAETGKFDLCIVSMGRAKNCALICINEMIDHTYTFGNETVKDVNGKYTLTRTRIDDPFLKQVKQEIEKL